MMFYDFDVMVLKEIVRVYLGSDVLIKDEVKIEDLIEKFIKKCLKGDFVID